MMIHLTHCSLAGNVSIDSILENYDFSIHPSVTAGDLTAQEAATEMMDAFSAGNGRFGRTRTYCYLSLFALFAAARD